MMEKVIANHHRGQNMLEDLFISRHYIIIWIVFVYIATIILQYFEKPLPIQTVVFTLIVVGLMSLHWFSRRLKSSHMPYFFIVQGSLIFLASLIMPMGSLAVLLGLLPIFISQAMIIYNNVYKIISVFLLIYLIYIVGVAMNYGATQLPGFIAIFFLVLASIIPLMIIIKRQFHDQHRIRNYVVQLEKAHKKVEELTLANERQRMARDLHDTLAQGLAGLIMQLEAVDAHLSKGNTLRSQQIIQQAMQRARKTLHDARGVIDDLRAATENDLAFDTIVAEEIHQFAEATGLPVQSEIKLNQPLSSLVKEQCFYILSEALTNIAKHAKATKVYVVITEDADSLLLEVKDNGVGFDKTSLGKQPGHYGVLGLYERARLMGGTLQVNSEPSDGTAIQLQVPIGKEEKE